MAKTLSQHRAEIEAMKVKFRKKARGTFIEMSVEFFQEIRLHTTESKFGGSPVKTGALSASMRANVGSVDSSTVSGYEANRGATGRIYSLPALEAYRSRLESSFEIGDTIYISNSVSYIKKIEGGSSRQTPGGVFKPTTTSFKAAYRGSLAAFAARVRLG